MGLCESIREWNRRRKRARKRAREKLELERCRQAPYPGPNRYCGEHGLWDSLASAVIVAHAGGGWNGRRYCNSEEAIGNAIHAGFRAIEVDVSMTRDGVPVLSHDFRPNGDGDRWPEVPAAAEFLSTPICGDETPLALDDLMERYVTDGRPVFMIDGKGRGAGERRLADFMVDRYSADRLAQLVFQVHDLEALRHVYGLEAFGAVHYCASLEMTVRARDELMKYGVHTVSIDEREFLDPDSLKPLRSCGIAPLIYTVDDVDRLKAVIEGGGAGVFTDILRPGCLSENRE